MSIPSGCGNPVPMLNPPDFGHAVRLSPWPVWSPQSVPYPGDPGYAIPRVITASGSSRQSVALSCEPPGVCAWDVRHPMQRGIGVGRVVSSFRNYGLNYAAQEIARILSQVLYPIPGIWLGPAYAHMPSGNLILQLAVPPAGPLDPVPVFTYNSMAAKGRGPRGYGISELFNPTVELLGADASLITGSGQQLYYQDIGVEVWASAPSVARNGLKIAYDGSVVERQPDGLKWVYGGSGLAQKILSPSGNVWTITRNSDCIISEIVAPGGRKTSISGTGGTFAVTQPGSVVTTFTVSGDRLTKVTYPDGSSMTLGYGSQNFLASLTDGAGHTTEFTYDSADRIKSITVGGNTYHYRYLFYQGPYQDENYVVATDPKGERTTIVHDCSVVKEIINPLGYRTTYVWEASADPRLQVIIDPENNRTTLSYEALFDGTRALKRIERPVVGSLDFGYGASGRCTSISDYDGNGTSLGWDSQENLTSVQDARGHTFGFSYNTQRQLTGTLDPLSNRTTTQYDTAGNATLLINELGRRTTMAYDTTGRLSSIQNPLGNITSYSRDSLGRITQVENPLTYTTKFTYTQDSCLKSIENPESETTSYTYNAEHQLLSVTDPLSHTSSYTYDSLGNLESTVNALGQTTSFLYDKISRKTASINPLGFRTTMTYDKVGNVKTTTNPENETSQSEYDAAYRVTASINPLGFRTSTTYNNCSLPTSVLNAENEQTTTVYNELNQVESVIDPLGHSTDNSYDTANRLESVANAEGETTTTLYDAASQVTGTINPLGYRLSNAYDAAGQLTAVTNPLGQVRITQYDAAGRATASIDPLGLVVTTAYDRADRVTAVTNAAGETTSTLYDTAGRKTTTINPLSFRTSFAYDAVNRLTATTDAEGGVSQTVYDAGGRFTASIDPLSHTTSTKYDKADRPIEVQDAEGARTTSVYDAAGRVTKVINALSKISTTVYDKANRVTESIDALGYRTTSIYDAAGRMTGSINAVGQRSTTTYDAANRPVAQVNPLGKTWTTVYDAAGQTTQSIDPLGHTDTTEYDPAGQVTATINAATNTTRSFYDDAGRLTAVLDGNSHITTTAYDNAYRPTVVIQSNGTRVTTVYDAGGRATEVLNEKGLRTTTVYDKVGRQTVAINPLNQRHTYAYDAAGRQTLRIDARGQRTTYTYDNVNREKTRQYQDGTQAAFDYDAVGNRTRMQDVTGTYTYTYDALNRKTAEIERNGKRTTFTYDGIGNRTSLAAANGTTSYTYDAAVRLIRMDNPYSERTTISYDDAGRTTLRELGNGTRTSISYDPASRVVEVANLKNDNTTITTDGYARNGVGDITSLLGNVAEIVNWPMDAIGQLYGDYYLSSAMAINAVKGTLQQWTDMSLDDWANMALDAAGAILAASQKMQYDDAGNRRFRIDEDTGEVTTYTYDDANRMLTAEDDSGVTTYAYDANGNQLTIEEPGGDVTTNTWDGENRLVRVEPPDSTIVTYSYNADGLQVEKNNDGTIERYVYDGNNRQYETDDLNAVEAAFTYLPSDYAIVLSQRRGSDSSFYHADGTQSVRKLTDPSEVVTDEYDFDAWGNNRSSTGSTFNTQQYKGELLAYRKDPDAAPDLQYALHHRNYDPKTGRFTSTDPIASDLNLYRYVSNNPISKDDPSGLDELDDRAKEISKKFAPQFNAISKQLEGFDRQLAAMQQTLGNARMEHTIFAMLESYQRQYEAIRQKHKDLIQEHNRVNVYYAANGGHVFPMEERLQQTLPVEEAFQKAQLEWYGPSRAINYLNRYIHDNNLVRPEGELEPATGYEIALGATWNVTTGLAPFVGEKDDFETLVGRYSTPFDRTMAGVSLAASVFTVTIAPNYGSTVRNSEHLVGNFSDVERFAYNTLDDLAAKAARGADNTQVIGLLSDTTRLMAERNIRNTGKTVLGPYNPESVRYITKAEAKNASYFDLGKHWDELTDSQRKAANFHFLDKIAAARDQVYLSVPKQKIARGTWLAREIEYLTKPISDGGLGYRWLNQWSLVPGN